MKWRIERIYKIKISASNKRENDITVVACRVNEDDPGRSQIAQQLLAHAHRSANMSNHAHALTLDPSAPRETDEVYTRYGRSQVHSLRTRTSIHIPLRAC